MIPNIGPAEIAILVVVALLVFGPKRLPELGSSMGKGIRGFGKGLKGEDKDDDLPLHEPEKPAVSVSVPEETLKP